MQVPLEISTRWIDLAPPLEAELRKRAGRLERHSDRITSCRIAVERPTGNHHQEGGPYRVRVDITVPGSELVADKSGEELYAAIRDAFDAAERQVETWADRRRGEVKAGITGWWQINGRSHVSPEEALRLDTFYIENWSFSLDLYILVKTLKTVLLRQGAY